MRSKEFSNYYTAWKAQESPISAAGVVTVTCIVKRPFFIGSQNVLNAVQMETLFLYECLFIIITISLSFFHKLDACGITLSKQPTFFKFVKTTYAPVLNVIFIISRSNQFLFDASVPLQRFIWSKV